MSRVLTGLEMQRRARIEVEIAIMTTYRPAFEAKRKARHGVEDRAAAKANLDVCDLPLSLDRSIPRA
ncbi:hypothetical protein [Chitinibacter sp. S2-10]|uniref:hypothetical protein n=1 Tax=Chitinibacter sp. S2-10 TaxID=3373597 RepID=UPI003977D524